MAPSTRRNSALAKKIATLQLRLAPLVPLPAGPPHPAFPDTLLAFHLLTEAELDSIAHYYHQSTPSQWTHRYPASMNWDKDFLAKPSSRTPHHPPPHTPVSATKEGKIRRRRSRPISHSDDVWLEDLMDTVEDIQSPLLFLPSHNGDDDDDGNEKKDMLANPTTTTAAAAVNPYANMSDKDRIRIKRRKVGKFIGLVGMETPVEEIAARIQSSLDRAMERSREELRRNEQIMTGRKKMA